MDRRRQSEVEPQSSVDPALLKEHIKGRLRQFVETSAEFRFSLSFDDDPGSQKRELLERLQSSDGFRRWKVEVLQSEIDFISGSGDSSRVVSRALMDERQWASHSIGNFVGQYTSTLPSFEYQNDDDDDEQQQQLDSRTSFALTGTMSASTFAFMGRNYLKHVVDVLMAPALMTEEDSAARYETMQALTQLPASDMCESEHWSEFKVALRKLLNSDSGSQQRRLSDAVLGFLVKLFNACSHNVTVDAFGLLADHLKEDVFGSKRIAFRVKDGRRLEFKEGTGVHVLQKLRVFDEMCLGFAKVLPRYSQQHQLEVAENAVTLLDPTLAMVTPAGPCLTPFMAWAVVDPKMKWWRSWMHGRLGRTAILSALEKRWSVVEFLLKIALDTVSEDAADSAQTSEKRLGLLRTAAASRMVESLLLYQESRLLLGGRIPNFPDDHLDQLLKNAVYGGRRSGFAWQISLALVMNAHGRTLFFDERRLRRIGTELQNKEWKYHTKIKLLNLVSELLKSYDPLVDSTARIFDWPLDCRDGKATFSQLIMSAVSDFIIAAYSRDPDAPLNLVYACFDTCTVLCRTRSGRRLVSEYPQFLIHAIKLVKEHSVEVSTLLPILVSVSLTDPAFDLVLKKFLASQSSRLDSADGFSRLLWHRPVELKASSIQAFADRLKDLQAKISLFDDLDSIDRCFAPFIRQLFLILCHPDGSKSLMHNDTFMQLLLEPFRGDDFQENALTDVSLNILSFALHRTDFLVGVRQRCDLAEEIAGLLTKCYASDEWSEAGGSQDVDDSSKFWIQNAFSTRLVDVYLKLRYLGGPSERLSIEGKLTALEEVLNDVSKCFSPEPSRFIVRPVTTGAAAMAERSEGETLVKFFISCVERKKRVHHADVLLQAVKEFEGTDQDVGADSTASEESMIYDAVLDYGKNLGILDREAASSCLSSFVQRIHELTVANKEAEKEVDWFAAVVYLIFGGHLEKSTDFLRKFAEAEAIAVKCAWPKMSCGPDFAAAVVREVASMVDTILENEVPRVLAAFTMHGTTTSGLVTFWLNQCFVNILDWPEICNYVTLAVTGGPKFQAFFCCCLCYQMAEQVCVRAHGQSDDRDLHPFLFGPFSFKLHNCISFLSHLSNKYM